MDFSTPNSEPVATRSKWAYPVSVPVTVISYLSLSSSSSSVKFCERLWLSATAAAAAAAVGVVESQLLDGGQGDDEALADEVGTQ